MGSTFLRDLEHSEKRTVSKTRQSSINMGRKRDVTDSSCRYSMRLLMKQARDRRTVFFLCLLTSVLFIALNVQLTTSPNYSGLSKANENGGGKRFNMQREQNLLEFALRGHEDEPREFDRSERTCELPPWGPLPAYKQVNVIQGRTFAEANRANIGGKWYDVVDIQCQRTVVRHNSSIASTEKQNNAGTIDASNIQNPSPKYADGIARSSAIALSKMQNNEIKEIEPSETGFTHDTTSMQSNETRTDNSTSTSNLGHDIVNGREHDPTVGDGVLRRPTAKLQLSEAPRRQNESDLQVEKSLYLSYRVNGDRRWRTDSIGILDEGTDLYRIPFPSHAKYMLVDCAGVQNIVRRPIHLPSRAERDSRIQNLPRTSQHQGQGTPLFRKVVAVVLDAVSRGMLGEQFPKTRGLMDGLLENQHDNFEAFSFERLNVIGKNTAPNKNYGLLAGLKMEVFDTLERYSPQGSPDHLKNTDLLFDRLTLAGYSTFYTGGDSSNSLQPFTLRAHDEKGHPVDPVDYLWPPGLAAESKAAYHRPSCTFPNTTKKTNNNGFLAFSIGDGYCVGEKPMAVHNFEALHEFLEKYDPEKAEVKQLGINGTFALFTLTEAHEPYVLYPSLDSVIHDNMVRLVEDEKLANSTLLLFLSDHGLHYGDQYTEWPFRVWHRNPFYYMMASRDVLDKHPQIRESLRANQMVLNTFFDLRQTILHAALGEENLIKLRLPQGTHADLFGRSLFNKLPADRSCWDAGVPYKFCMCDVEQGGLKDVDEQMKKRAFEIAKERLGESKPAEKIVKQCEWNSSTPLKVLSVSITEPVDIQRHDGLENTWFKVIAHYECRNSSDVQTLPQKQAWCSRPMREDIKYSKNNLLCSLDI